MQMTGYGGGPGSQGVVPVNTNFVRFAPAPRSVTSLVMLIPATRLNVPAARKTTCPGGHIAIASLISGAVLPGFTVAQIVVRFGVPPGIPARLQSMAREGSRMPDHGSAATGIIGTPFSASDSHRASAIPAHLVPRALNFRPFISALPMPQRGSVF